MEQIVECVPNFSEGRRKDVIDALSKAITSVDGCVLLDVDPGVSTNRTVITFVGSPKAVLEGAMAAARIAFVSIDMSAQHGSHPRIGAMDVCPFIPVSNITMHECVELSREFARRLSAELNVSIYLYAESQTNKKRSELPDIRKGEYEALGERMKTAEWKPDFGPCELVPQWGATCVGAREFLVAFNINVLGTKEQAHRIALNVREQGRSEKEPGRLKAVRAIGWLLEEANMAQISINLINYNVTNMHTAFEECKKDAEELNLALCGSQIVGLVPLASMLDVASYYIAKENLMVYEEDQKIKLAIQRLGLNSLGQFNPKERIIEYIIKEREGDKERPYLNMDLKKFTQAVGARTVAPGGGCVAALVASLGSALTCMTALLSYGSRKFEKNDPKMKDLIPMLYYTYNDLLLFIDQDAVAFNSYIEARKLPETSVEEKEIKNTQINKALISCVEVPLTVCRKAAAVWSVLVKLVPLANIEARSDFMVGVKCLDTGIYGAHLNVLTNLKSFDASMKDQTEKYRVEALKLWEESKERSESLLKMLEERTV